MPRPENTSWIWWNSANIVSSTRLLAPFIFFIVPVFFQISIIWIIVIYSGLALTDAFDGWLARLVGNDSSIGIIIDIVADKVLLLSGFTYLLFSGIFDKYVSVLAILVIIQELRTARLMVEAVNMVAERSFREKPATGWKEKYIYAYSQVVNSIIEKFKVHDYGKGKMICYGIGIYMFIWDYFAPHKYVYALTVISLVTGIYCSIAALRKYKFDFESWKSEFFSKK